jgi:hypothetical protein
MADRAEAPFDNDTRKVSDDQGATMNEHHTTKTGASCCGPTVKATCCAPSDKSACCGNEASTGRCGCR